MKLERYNRQMIFSGIGNKGQEKLSESRISIIGCGGLGCCSANIMVRSGVGTVVIADRDFVEIHGLHRQILFDENDAKDKMPKVAAAKEKLTRANSEVNIIPVLTDVSAENIEQIIHGSDLVIDGSDNIELRFLINDACVKHNIPWIYGGILGSYGVTFTIIPHATPCFRCIFGNMPPKGSVPSCLTHGVIAPAVLTISSMQCAEAIKILTGRRELINPCLTAVDLWENTIQHIKISESQSQPDCICCGRGIFEFLNPHYS
jgi:adenylyltransferase/sulfurtransferase